MKKNIEYTDSFKTFIWLDVEKFRFIHHGFANLLEIQEWVVVKNWFGVKSGKWKSIYMGHSNPIEEAIMFFNKNQKN